MGKLSFSADELNKLNPLLSEIIRGSITDKIDQLIVETLEAAEKRFRAQIEEAKLKMVREVFDFLIVKTEDFGNNTQISLVLNLPEKKEEPLNAK